MTLTKQQVREILDVYIRAWESQDPELIGTIFTEGATYHERVMGEPIRTRQGIRDYWQSKVVGGQANISCDLLNLYLDDGTAIAEWEATFDDTAQGVRKRMLEVALLTFDGPLISSLREYWASEELPAAALAHQQRSPNGQ
jgi:SnoaL-like domain